VSGGSAGEAPVPFAVPERLRLVDSTNHYLVELARSGLGDGSEVPEGYAVVAECQGEGRGRLARRWVAPAGTAVLCSILFRPDLDPEQLHLTAWAVALAAARACREVAGVELSLKWPNDLLAGPDGAAGKPAGPDGAAGKPEAPCGGNPDALAGHPGAERPGARRKVAGVLSEVVPTGVVVGIGINVNWPPDWPPASPEDPELAFMAQHATALNRVAGREIDRNELVDRLLRFTGKLNARLASDQGRRALASEYRLACSTIGREVRVELAGETVAGRAMGVDDGGCLLVSTATGVRTIAAGDVVHVR
jgi:BirA family biotin operon repressor/biotin-[acetyl-CoA-carboxylase] ligase